MNNILLTQIFIDKIDYPNKQLNYKNISLSINYKKNKKNLKKMSTSF